MVDARISALVTKYVDLTKNDLYSQDPNVVAQVLEFALSMEVPPQDSIVTLTSVASNRYSYKQAWTFFANNIDKITKRYCFCFFFVKAKLIYKEAIIWKKFNKLFFCIGILGVFSLWQDLSRQ